MGTADGCMERDRLVNEYRSAITLHQERQDELAAVRERFFAVAASRPFDLIRQPTHAVDAAGLQDLTAAEVRAREVGAQKTKARMAVVIHEATCPACRG